MSRGEPVRELGCRRGVVWFRPSVNACLFAIVLGGPSLLAQRGSSTSSTSTTATDPYGMGGLGAGISAQSRRGDVPDEPESASMRVRRELALRQQRRERLLASANRLVELTKTLQAEVAGHATLTPQDERALDDIAKAAREVKSRMTE